MTTTPRRARSVLIAFATLASVSCSEPPPQPPPANADSARYPFEVVCEAPPFDGDSTYTLGPLQGTTGPVRCGPAGGESEMTWTFIEHANRFDVYTVTRNRSAEGIDAVVETAHVKYIGSAKIIFEDDRQRVVMRPVSKTPPY